MPRKHAILSPSSSARWLVCPPSAVLNAQLEDTNSPYAKEGTLAHSLAEVKVRKALGEEVVVPICNDAEMSECTELYCDFIMEAVENARVFCRDPTVYVEQEISAEKWAEGCRGTADCILISDNILHIIDLKYGQLEVSAQNNSQLRIYAISAVDAFAPLYDFKEVKMTIFQPRLNHCDTFSESVEDLMEWAEHTLRPTAELAAKGEGEFFAGEHCRFCKVKATCRKRAEYNLMLAQYDFEPAATLEDAEIEAILAKADALTAWVADVKEYALSQALAGKQWAGYKLVEGRSVRKYTDETAVADAVRAAGFEPYEHKILGLTAMTKLLGKQKFDTILGSLVEKPKGKPTLVPMSDKRPIWNTAKEDFMEE